MRRILSFLLIIIFLHSATGCTNSISEEANFYYCAAEYQYGKDSAVILYESRDISGHEEELSYLISLYLAGPSGKALVSPFPKNTKLISVNSIDEDVSIELSYLGRQLSDSEFVLACACLTLSTMEFTQAQHITITSGERSITMNRNDLLLYDTVTAQVPTEVAE